MDKISQYPPPLRTIWLLEGRNYSYKAVFILCQPVINRVGHSTAPGWTVAWNERDNDGVRRAERKINSVLTFKTACRGGGLVCLFVFLWFHCKNYSGIKETMTIIGYLAVTEQIWSSLAFRVVVWLLLNIRIYCGFIYFVSFHTLYVLFGIHSSADSWALMLHRAELVLPSSLQFWNPPRCKLVITSSTVFKNCRILPFLNPTVELNKAVSMRHIPPVSPVFKQLSFNT